MITLHETHFLLIVFLIALITYIISSYYNNCNVDCKINYYKYENYHDKSKKDPEPQNVHQIMAKSTSNNLNDIKLDRIPDIDIDFEKTYKDNYYDLPIRDNMTTSNVGDRSSSHNGSIQLTDIDGPRNDDMYINKLFRGLY